MTPCAVFGEWFLSPEAALRPGKPQVKEEESSSSKATLLFEFFCPPPIWFRCQFRVRFSNVGFVCANSVCFVNRGD